MYTQTFFSVCLFARVWLSVCLSVCLSAQVVGLDAHPTRSDELAPFLIEHLLALQRHPWLSNSNLLFMGERNSGGSVGTILGYVQQRRDIRRFYPLKQDAKKDWGLFTDATNKPLMAEAARGKLEEGAVAFMHDMVVSNVAKRNKHPHWTDEQHRDDMKQVLFDQLRRLRYHATAPQTAYATQRFGVSGKLDDTGKPRDGYDDDVAIAFCMNVYVWCLFHRRQLPGLNYEMLMPQQFQNRRYR